MKNTAISLFLALVATVLLSCVSALPTVAQTANKPSIMPLSEVKEGMRGVAKTVFKGSKSEEFSVEILGILPGGVGPHQDLIIGTLSGANALRTFVFAGMSGSPVYIDGKLVGAVSYSFPFSKEPICGITPIEQMISIFEKTPSPKAMSGQLRTYTSAELLADTWHPVGLRNVLSDAVATGMAADSRVAAIAGQTFRPIATPMTFSGVSQSTLDAFGRELIAAGILPVAAAGGKAEISPLARSNDKTLIGGDSIIVHLARGDVSIAAAGTVTLRDGDKIYAFGHPYFGLGATDLPMSESHVVTVVPNANNSFKLTVPDAMVGALTQDRATGIFGKLGQDPKMVPVKLTVTNSRGTVEKYKFESAIDDFLTPLIVNIGVLNSLNANERTLGDTTVKLSGEIAVAGEKSVKLERRFAGTQASAFAGASVAVPLGALLKSSFDSLMVTGVTLDLSVMEGARAATIERLTTDRSVVHAGETINLKAFIRTDTGTTIVQNVPLTIPQGSGPGTISITVGDGAALQEKSAAQQFVPRTAAELISNINGLKRPDKVYVIAFRTSTGAIVGSSEMPNLPPTVLATLNNDRSVGGTKPSVQTVLVDQEIAPIEYLISGLQTLSIEIVR